MIFAEFAEIGREPACRGKGIGVVVAQDSAAAGQGVVVELAGLLVLTQRSQGEPEETGYLQGVR